MNPTEFTHCPVYDFLSATSTEGMCSGAHMPCNRHCCVIMLLDYLSSRCGDPMAMMTEVKEILDRYR